MALPVNHPINDHIVAINWPDSSGTTSCFGTFPFKGKIMKAFAVLQGQTIGTANNVLGLKVNGTACSTEAAWTQLTSGSAAGDIVTAIPTTNNVGDEGTLIEITSDGGGSNTCPTVVFLVLRAQ